MFKALVNDKHWVTASSFTALKQAASRVANNDFNTFDEMKVYWTHNDPNMGEPRKEPIVYQRWNKKSPNNKITRGSWH